MRQDWLLQDAQVLFFDCDGVMLNSSEERVDMTNRVLAQIFGIDNQVTVDAMREYFGLSTEKWWEYLINHVFVHTVQQQHISAAGATQLYFEASKHNGHTIFCPGMPDVLSVLSKSYQIAITTNRVNCLLDQLRALNLGFPIFSPNGKLRQKPYPDILNAAAEALGFQPQKCIVIEDSPEGFAAAQAAGMRVVGVGTGACSFDELLQHQRDGLIHAAIPSFEDFNSLSKIF